MKNTKLVGDVSEAKVTAALLAKGKVVLTPFGDNQRYDLVIHENGETFSTIQCKTGRISKYNSVKFYPKSCSCNGKHRSNYRGQVDYFGVYCPDNDKCYLVPVNQAGTSVCNLRLGEPKIKMDYHALKATNYEL